MTYSIVARDPDTGDLGVAVQTCYFNVGPIVPWAAPGIGAVATQSFTQVSYGPLGLDLLRAGRSAPDALRELLATDEDRSIRQVAMIDAESRIGVHTGDRCVPEAGSAQGQGVSAQANMMERATVWDAMLAAFDAAPGQLGERLVAALEGAEAEGGDIRGRQSAAVVVVSGDSSTPHWERLVDLRVDDHPAPVQELGRLLRLHRAFERMGSGNDLVQQGDLAGAVPAFEDALGLAPDDPQIAFWSGLAFTFADPARGGELLARARAANGRYPSFLRRLARAGFFPNEPTLLDSLLPIEGSAPDQPG